MFDLFELDAFSEELQPEKAKLKIVKDKPKLNLNERRLFINFLQKEKCKLENFGLKFLSWAIERSLRNKLAFFLKEISELFLFLIDQKNRRKFRKVTASTDGFKVGRASIVDFRFDVKIIFFPEFIEPDRVQRHRINGLIIHIKVW